MANKVLIKRSAVASKVPTTSDLDLGELAINTYDGKVYIKKDNGTASITQVGGGAVTTSGLTMSTARLLGRTTASTGAIEEISAGTGLTLSSGTLAFSLGDGTVTAPSLAPASDTNTGVWFPAADTVAVSTGGTERLRVTSGGNVGIGTTDFTYGKLAVSGDISINASGAAKFAWNNSGAYYNWIEAGGVAGDNYIRFACGNAEQMRLTVAGNLGLGVTPVNDQLGVSIQTQRARFSGGANDRALISYNYYRTSGVNTYIASDYATLYDQINGQHRWFTAPSGTAGNAITFTQAMTLDASGNLLVGTTSGSTRLRVAASNPTNGIVAEISNSRDTTGRTGTFFSFDAPNLSAWKIGIPADVGAFSFYDAVAGAERARIDSSGNLIVGATSGSARISAVANNPTNGVVGAISNSRDTTGRTGTYFIFDASNVSTWKIGIPSDVAAFSFYDVIAGAERARFDSSGTLLIGTATSTSLDSNSKVLIDNGAYGGLEVRGSTGSFFHMTGGSSRHEIFSTSGDLQFRRTNSGTTTEQLRINGLGVLILGSGEAGTPTGNTFRAPSAAGTNVAGGNLVIAGGAGTGTGGGGYIAFQTAAAGSTGTTANTLTERVRIHASGNVSIGNTTDGAFLTLGAGTATANTGPLKFTSGTNLTTPEAGTVEYDGTIVTATSNTNFKRGTVPITNYTSGAGSNLSANSETTLGNLLPSANDTITLSSGTYFVDIAFNVTRTGTSTTSATARLNLLGSGTAAGSFSGMSLSAAAAAGATSNFSFDAVNINTSNVLTAATATAGAVYTMTLRGIVKITTGGTIVPQYNLSAVLGVGASGGASVKVLYFKLQQLDSQNNAAFGPAGTGWG